MSHRGRLVALGMKFTACAGLLAGCGSYDKGTNDGNGGSSPSAGTSGSTASAGMSGSTAGGGASGSAAAGGSGQPSGGAGGQSGGSGGAGNGGASAGSGGANVSCSEVQPCGGAVVGTWKAASCMLDVSGMVDMAATGLACPSAPVTGALAVSGTWSADAAGTYMDATTTSGQLMIELAEQCKSISGTTTTCDRVVLGALGLNSIVCTDNTATRGCSCTATVEQQGRPAFIAVEHPMSGTFTTDGNRLVTTADGRNTEYSYCVADDTLTMKLETAGQVGTVTGTIVFQKQ